MNLIGRIKLDIAANSNPPNGKGRFIVVLYRLANYFTCHKNLVVKLIGLPISKFYYYLCTWIMGVEIPAKTKIGTGLQVWHAEGLVINSASIIGNNVVLRHTTTIGNKYPGSPCPVIGNNVEIGAHTIIIGGITIGENSIIGAGSVVTKSVPPNSVAYGNPLVVKSRYKNRETNESSTYLNK